MATTAKSPEVIEAERLLKEGVVTHRIPFTPPNLDELIAQARADMNLAASTNKGVKKLEVPNAAAVNALLAESSRLATIEKEAKAARAQITDTLKELAGTPDENTPEVELTVHGATVFTVKRITARVLNQEHIKALFPDTPDNAELWKDQVSTRGDYA